MNDSVDAGPHLETALVHAVRRVPTGRSDESVGAAVARLPGAQFDYAGSLYVLDAADRLAGAVSMATLLAADANVRLADLAQRDYPAIDPQTDQEQVASLAIHYGVSAVPLVDRAGGLIGVVPPQSLLKVLRDEHIEDLHRLAGILHETARAQSSIEAPPIRRARDRLPWLLVGLVGSAMATMLVASFEGALQERVAIAFFVPAIVYLADAIGTQTEAVAVRGLSLSSVPIGRLIADEVRTGMLIGLALSLIAFVPVWLAFNDPRLAIAVAGALLAASTVASAVGILFPWLLLRVGRDPAFGSGPVATIVQDLLTLLIYFGAVTSLL